jgi:hypothetical protein
MFIDADFAALVPRGLDPYWLPDDPQDVFDRPIRTIAEGESLRRHRVGARFSEVGFRLHHQQEVLEFMCAHGHDNDAKAA